MHSENIDQLTLLTNTVRYANEFGILEITPETEFVPIKMINKNHPKAKEHSFDFDTAEKIALITGNKSVQICFPYPLNGCAYLVLHNSPSTAAICRVDLQSFVCEKTPANMLSQLNRGISVSL